jgi:hypothetical protein
VLVGRAFLKASIVVLGVLLAVEVSIGLAVIGGAGDIGVDFRFYRAVGQTWLWDRSYYLGHQLAGPYEVTTLVDVLYPPTALYLFVPFVYLPDVLWWVIPTVILGANLWFWRPRLWAVPLMILCLMPFRSFGAFLWGNTDMWFASAVAAGLRWSWPAVFLLLKPSVGPFALLGALKRSFWIALACLGLASLPLASLWLDWVTAMRNLHASLDYSLGSLSLYLIPILAWLARTRPAHPEQSVGDPPVSARREPDDHQRAGGHDH